MKLLKTLGSALCLAFLLTPLLSKAQALTAGQVYTTGNIVQNTPQGGPTPWVGGVYQDNLTCWGQWGDTGYCGPSPIVRPGGNINFSYGSSYIYQQQHISTLLPSATGLQVNGYNFGFMAKNGNGWDDGRTDNLMALVRFWDNTNGRGATNLLYGDVYSLNYKFNWTSFDYSKTFTTPLAVPSIGQIQYGFIGKDNNGWAGPYGPEIYNVSFSLKYSVDPCATNVLSSPSCPGYFAALAKLAPAPVAPEPAAPPPPEVFAVAPSAPLPPGAPPPPPGVPPPVQESSQQTQPAQNQPGPPPPGPAPQQAASQPASSGQQAKAGEVADSGGGGKSSSPVSLSSVLSMISSNQDKTSALEKSVVQSADAQAFSAGESAKQQAEKVAGDAQSQSISGGAGSASVGQSSGTQSSFTQTQSSMASLQGQGNPQSNNASNSARIQQSINSSVTSQSSEINFTGTTTQQNSYQNTTKQEVNIQMSEPTTAYSLVTPTRSSFQLQIEIPMLEGIKFGHRGAVDNAMESKPFMPQINDNSQQNDSVKKNIDNNELAGNITIDSIAKQPANYSQYFFMIPDVAFYAPKEIYRNQKTVDNVRALRQMSSDKLHQDMVNQQYK